MKKLLLTITLLTTVTSQANTGHDHGEAAALLSLSTFAAPAAVMCSTHSGEEAALCMSTSVYTTLALYVTSSILILAEQVVLERGTDGLLNADTEGYIDDVVLLEALDVIREVKPEKTDHMNDVQVIKLVQKEKNEKTES